MTTINTYLSLVFWLFLSSLFSLIAEENEKYLNLTICSCSRNLVHIKLCGEELVTFIAKLNSVVDLPAHWLFLTGGCQQSSCLASLLSSSLSGSILLKFFLICGHGMPGDIKDVEGRERGEKL